LKSEPARGSGGFLPLCPSRHRLRATGREVYRFGDAVAVFSPTSATRGSDAAPDN
jgi:hypothetical protein